MNDRPAIVAIVLVTLLALAMFFVGQVTARVDRTTETGRSNYQTECPNYHDRLDEIRDRLVDIRATQLAGHRR